MIDWTPIVVSAIGAIGSVGVAWMALTQARLAKEKAISTHDAVNSRMDEMKKLIQTSAYAEGQKAERDATMAKQIAFEAGQRQTEKELE